MAFSGTTPRVAPATRPDPTRRPRRPSTARRRRRSRRAARVVLVALLTVVVGLTTFVGGLLAAPFDERAVPPPPKSVLLLAADGTQFATIPPPERRDVVSAADIPDVMRHAIISAEDERFLDHNGVDPIATVRAAIRDLSGGRLQGGSTLTQQYVKNTYVENERTLIRKIREAAISVRLESRKSKQDILTDYLNVLYLGNGVYGVQAAAKYYFGVDVRDLDLDEATGRRDPVLGVARASVLAGIAPAPSVWNPVRDMPAAKVRQRYTLNRMVINGLLAPEQAAEAFGRDVTPLQETVPVPPTSVPEFADLVQAELKQQYSGDREDLLFRGGLRVTTTLDADLQEAVTRAAREVLPDRADPQAAVVAFDYVTGDVKAMTTLRRYPAKVDNAGNRVEGVDGYERGGYNLATAAHRSIGSTIKPFTLAVALQQGHTLDERRRAPGRDSIPNPGGKPDPYVYGNAGDSSYRGSLTLKAALQRSVNTVYVPLANEVGRGRIADLLTAAGAKGNPLKPGNMSFGLGAGAEVTPLSMANAYGTLMNNGVRVEPRYITGIVDADGRERDTADRTPKTTPVLPPEIAQQVVEAMAGVTAPGGTATAARQDFVVYGKTGTTNGSVDAWFVGCAKEPQRMCVATWMGYEFQSCARVEGRSCGGMVNVHGVEQVYGGTLPARIFDRTIELLGQVKAERAAAAAAAAAGPPPAPGDGTQAPADRAQPPADRPRSQPPAAPAAPAPRRSTPPAARTPAPQASPAEPGPADSSAPPPSRRPSSPTPSEDEDEDGGVLPTRLPG
jgi:membrane peptidoglycan carboxypeptidase